MEKFNYLKEAYIDWCTNKTIEQLKYDTPYEKEELLKKLKLTPRKFFKKYLDIFNGRTQEELQAIFDMIALFLQKDRDSFFNVSINLEVMSLVNAIEWTEIFIGKAFGFEPRKQTYNQCLICGKTEDYAYKDRNGISHECTFKKVKYCHVDGCTPVNVDKNYPAHEKCCYGKLEKIRKQKKEQYSGKYRTKEENIKDFLNLCEEIFQDRLKNAEYTVQHIDRHGQFFPAKHKSEWGKEIVGLQEYIENPKTQQKIN